MLDLFWLTSWFAWLLAVPALYALVLTWLNLWRWPRAKDVGNSTHLGPVSVLIPARNEAHNIAKCVAACMRLGADEVLVYDDGSTDATREILGQLMKNGARGLRVIEGSALPQGWAGKPHACMQLAHNARNNALLFLDADVEVASDALGRLADLERRFGDSVFTAVPLQHMGTPIERLIVPLLYTTYTSWLYLPWIHEHADSRFLAANGQFLFLRRHTYDRVGGFGRVRGQVVDDMAFCRAAKQSGVRVLFADGARLASCRMYLDSGSLLGGFSRSLSAGFGGSTLAIAACGALYAWSFVLPAIVACVTTTQSPWHVPSVAATAAAWFARGALALRFRHPLWSVIVAPLGALALLGIAAHAAVSAQQGSVLWKGRRYAAGTTSREQA